MKNLTQEDIKAIAEKDDLHIAPFRSDGKTYGTPTWIWNVSVDGELFVRAYNGKQSSWYQSALKQKSGKIEAVGESFAVDFEAVEGEEINQKIDAAYEKKYAKSPYLGSMVKARTATVKIVPKK